MKALQVATVTLTLIASIFATAQLANQGLKPNLKPGGLDALDAKLAKPIEVSKEMVYFYMKQAKVNYLGPITPSEYNLTPRNPYYSDDIFLDMMTNGRYAANLNVALMYPNAAIGVQVNSINKGKPIVVMVTGYGIGKVTFSVKSGTSTNTITEECGKDGKAVVVPYVIPSSTGWNFINFNLKEGTLNFKGVKVQPI